METEVKNKLFITKIVRIIFIAVVAIIGLWLYGLNTFVNDIPLGVEDSETKTDAVVILTGGSNRLEEGLKLLYKQKADKMFISGVGEGANLASMLLLSGYVPINIAELSKKIELGYEAKNTKGNAEEVYQWIQKNNIKSIRLVTGNYHIRRSLVEFKRKVPEVQIIPNPVMPEQFSLEKWWTKGSMKTLLVTEYNKYLVTKIGLSV